MYARLARISQSKEVTRSARARANVKFCNSAASRVVIAKWLAPPIAKWQSYWPGKRWDLSMKSFLFSFVSFASATRQTSCLAGKINDVTRRAMQGNKAARRSSRRIASRRGSNDGRVRKALSPLVFAVVFSGGEKIDRKQRREKGEGKKNANGYAPGMRSRGISMRIVTRSHGDDAWLQKIPPESERNARKAYRARGHRCIVIFPHTRARRARRNARQTEARAAPRRVAEKCRRSLFDNLVPFHHRISRSPAIRRADLARKKNACRRSWNPAIRWYKWLFLSSNFSLWSDTFVYV